MGTENKPTYKAGFWKDHSSAWKLSDSYMDPTGTAIGRT